MIDLRILMPQTAQDVYDNADMIMRCVLEANPEPEENIIEWYAKNPHVLYLFYDGDKPFCFVRLDDRAVDPTLGKGTVQIHGAVLPEYMEYADIPAKMIIELAFKVKRKIIAKISPDNLGAVGFCRKWGFKRINRENGLNVYRLKRGDYLRQHSA